MELTSTIELDGTYSIYSPHHLISKGDFKLKHPPLTPLIFLTFRTTFANNSSISDGSIISPLVQSPLSNVSYNRSTFEKESIPTK